jgi:uncharacterized protein (DUF2235 family)
MPKNIIFCADGTWNGPGQDEDHDRGGDPSNVFKLFVNLAGVDAPGTLRLADEQERSVTTPDGTVQQVAKYLHGVGDSDNFLVKAVGGVGGAGLVTRIVRGYTFISRNFQAGDRIYITGFSRGAYTARALAGLIAARGVIDGTRIELEDKERAYRLGSAEWFEYRRRALHARPNLFGQLQEIAFDLPGFVTKPPMAPRVEDVAMEAVAVWDTVGALGIPAYNVKSSARLDAFQFADTALSPKVRHAVHAVAVDERRNDFTPTLWDADPRIVQALFPGAHADVGGGYPQAKGESCLSDGGLEWVMGELTKLQVLFKDPFSFVPNANGCGVSHRPWMDPPFDVMPNGPRTFPTGLALHRSVLTRLLGPLSATAPGSYDPGNLLDYVIGREAKAGVVIVG